MKRFLLLCALWIGSACAANSQKTDTLCFTLEEAQGFAIIKRQRKALDSLNMVLRLDINSLQRTVQALEVKDANSRQIAATYEAMAGTMREQRRVLESEVERVSKDLRRQKRKTTAATIGGLLLTGLTTFLLITK